TARLRVEFALGCAWNSRSGHRGIGARVAVEFALEYAWNMHAGVRAEIVRKVDALLPLKQSGSEAQAQCEALARKIDFALYAAYGVGREEIALIESRDRKR
ncbi:hypothetical protein, partial [Paraburkholderia tagetis]